MVNNAENNGERIAKLEAIVAGLLAGGTSRADFEAKVLEKLAVIVHQQGEFCNYQKTCEAKGDAHDVRLNNLENALSGFGTARKTLLWFCGILGSMAVFLVTLAGLLVKHG